MKASVLESIKKSAAVPSMPQVVLRFLEIMQDPEFEYRDLVKVLSADAGTVSEVLRLANSALFGVRNKIVSLQQALTLLGPKRIRSVLLGRYLVDSMAKKKVGGLDMAYFWRRSLASSVLASHFAKETLPRQQDETSIAGLLADIGIPILAEALPEAYQPILKQYCQNGEYISMEDELDAVEVSHGQVSAMVLSHWRLPEEVCNAANLHQSPSPGNDAVATIARILFASDRIAKLLCDTPQTETVVNVCTEAMSFINADMSVLISVLPTVEADIEDLADALRIDVIPSDVYEMMTQTLHSASPLGA